MFVAINFMPHQKFNGAQHMTRSPFMDEGHIVNYWYAGNFPIKSTGIALNISLA